MTTATYRLFRQIHGRGSFGEVTVTDETPTTEVTGPVEWVDAAREGVCAAIEAFSDDVASREITIEAVRWTAVDTTPDAIHAAAFLAVARLLGLESNTELAHRGGVWTVRRVAMDDRVQPGQGVESETATSSHRRLVAMPMGDAVRCLRSCPHLEVEQPRALTDHLVQSIQAGVVFLMARWSAQSTIALSVLTTMLEKREQSLEVYLVDTDDDATREVFARHWPGHPLGGAGEMLWVRDGRVVAHASSATFGRSPRQLEACLEAVLND